MRLTNKSELFGYTRKYENYACIREMTLKLGQIEDIEEDLGIDLVTLFKALKNGIYVNNEHIYHGLDKKQNDDIQLFECRLLDGINGLGIIHTSMFKGREVVRDYLFKDYGITWALTKKELEEP